MSHEAKKDKRKLILFCFVRCGENKAPTTSFIVVFMEHAYYNGGKLDENFSSFILEG